MDEFRSRVKKILNIYRAVLITAIVIFAALNIFEITGILESETVESDIGNGFGTGICTAIIFFMAISIYKCSSALKNEDKLKKLYIAETDERERLIYEKTNSSSFRTIIILLGLSEMIASFLSKTVFNTIFVIIIAIAFIQVAFKFYYRRKY